MADELRGKRVTTDGVVVGEGRHAHHTAEADAS